ncbi:MAG: MBL fold metallo-hydrolase [Pseudomonadales bacterium]|nr:MBL fold metallo-hydrolase [Pseudomonadales bacterium]
MRWWQWLLVALLVLVGGGAGYAYWIVQSLYAEPVTDDLWVIYGLGGNVGVLNTEAGAVIVDTMTLEIQGDRIRKRARELTGKPVVMIINTHYHLDHTHGNPSFDPGTRIISTDRTLEHLKNMDAEFFSGEAARFLPNETFEEEQTISIGGKTMKLVHPGRGHTDGDLVVQFVEDNALHAGDLFFHGHYPNIDLEAGGSVMQWDETLDAVFELSFDKVIPGHGPQTDREAFRQFQAFMHQLGEIGETAAAEGWSLEQMVKTDRLDEDRGYEPIRMIVSIGLDREFVLTRAWEEATGKAVPAE